MPPRLEGINCRNVYMRGDMFEICDYLQTEETPSNFEIISNGISSIWNDFSNSINVWWHGGNEENEGSRAGQFWCGLAGMNFEGWDYDFVDGACEMIGEHVPMGRY